MIKPQTLKDLRLLAKEAKKDNIINTIRSVFESIFLNPLKLCVEEDFWVNMAIGRRAHVPL